MSILCNGAARHANLLLRHAPLSTARGPQGGGEVGVDALFDNRGGGVVQGLHFVGVHAFDFKNLFERGDETVPPATRCSLFFGFLLFLRGADVQLADVAHALLQSGQVGFRVEAVPCLNLAFHLGQGAD